MDSRHRENRLFARWIAVAGLACTGFACAAYAGCPIQFSDVTADTGISFRHTDGSCGRRYIMESMCAGVALFDYDRDGDLDIYFLNGRPLGGTRTGPLPQNALYRNDGDFHFTDVTQHAGVGDTGFGLGVAVGDYDNDGHSDLFLNNYGPNVLYRNNGDGTFTDVTAKAGVAGARQVGAGANFLDMDKDGDLDLFVSNYIAFSPELHVVHDIGGNPIYSGPSDYPPQPNILYRNEGNGTFSDATVQSGIGAHKGKGMGTACADYDNDGDTDIIVANDEWGNFLFQNDGTGKFEEMGLISGIGYDVNGDPQSSMAVACGDYDNDGWVDLFLSALGRNRLLRNLGGRSGR